MGVCFSSRKPREGSSGQSVSAVVVYQDKLARKDEHEFVLRLMPMAQSRAGAGLQRDVIDAELGEADGFAELALMFSDEPFGPDHRVVFGLARRFGSVGETGDPRIQVRLR